MAHRQYKRWVSTIALSIMLTACASTLSRTSMPSPAMGLTGELIGSHTYYPAHLLMAGVTGRAVVAYSISPSGIPKDVAVIHSDNPAFAAEAVQFVRDWHFDVPSDWSKEGGPEHRFRLQLIFLINGRPSPTPYPNVTTIPVEGTAD
jgi:TonB family protein